MSLVGEHCEVRTTALAGRSRIGLGRGDLCGRGFLIGDEGQAPYAAESTLVPHIGIVGASTGVHRGCDWIGSVCEYVAGGNASASC